MYGGVDRLRVLKNRRVESAQLEASNYYLKTQQSLKLNAKSIAAEQSGDSGGQLPESQFTAAAPEICVAGGFKDAPEKKYENFCNVLPIRNIIV
jgi:hypothetical protein